MNADSSVVDMNDKPLVSYILLCFNQSEFLQSALNGALSQTYSPLEIIISDDCSTDNSFELITAVVNNYNGPHKLIINRNSYNVGTSEHLNNAIAKASGDFLVFASGDDISSEARVNTLVEYREKSSLTALFSNVIKINEASQSLGVMFDKPPLFAEQITDVLVGKPYWTIGASFACDKRVFDAFKPLSQNVLQEDGSIVFRALLLGTVGYVDKPLVEYRAHSGSVSQHQSARKRLILKRSEYYMHVSNLQDAVFIKNGNDDVIEYLNRKKNWAFIKHCFYKLPLCGLFYNKLRIVLGRFKRALQQ